jgi:multidrug resistance efflux pump
MALKKTVFRIAVGVLAFLLVCTFLSKTVYNLTKTSVRAATPEQGVIEYAYSAGPVGWIEYGNAVEVKALGDWLVAEVFVEDGQALKAGSPLMRVEMDGFGMRKAELELSVLRIENRIAALQAAEDEGAGEFDAYPFERAIDDARENLGRRQAELAELRARGANGADGFGELARQRAIEDASLALEKRLSELAEAEAALAGSYGTLDSYRQAAAAAGDAERALARAREDAARMSGDSEESYSEERRLASEAVSDAEKGLERAQADLERARAAFGKAKGAADGSGALREARLELDIERGRLAELEVSFPAGGMVACPIDGKAYLLAARAGELAHKGDALLSVVPRDDLPILKFRLPMEAGGEYGAGSIGEFKATALRGMRDTVSVSGEFAVAAVEYLAGRGELEFSSQPLAGAAPIPGAAADVGVSRTTAPQRFVLPASCLVLVEGGRYAVYTVESRDSLFGTERYVFQLPVRVLENNGLLCSIVADLSDTLGSSEVVVYASRALSDREIVTVAP